MSKDKINGIITRGVGGLYGVRIQNEDGGYSCDEVLCRARGVFRHEQLTPTVGDDVVLESVSEDCVPDNGKITSKLGSGRENVGRHGKKNRFDETEVNFVIDEILPRRSLMIRPALANLNYLFAVIPAASPEPDLLTADKLTVIAENYGIETVVIINKADLDEKRARELAEIYKTAGYETFLISASSGFGVDKLGNYISDISRDISNKDGTDSANKHISGAFAGVSGAGKSTLMTALFPNLHLTTGSVSRKTERGRHTTRHVELYPIETGGSVFWLADTPGFSMLDFTRFDFFPYDELALSFREFSDCIGECRYTKCTHLCEDGCAVIKKMNEGKIAVSRHDSYVRIFEEQRSVPEWKRR